MTLHEDGIASLAMTQLANNVKWQQCACGAWSALNPLTTERVLLSEEEG